MNRICSFAFAILLIATAGCGGGFAPTVNHWPKVKYTEVKSLRLARGR